jgi:hypothetical protein
MTQNNRKLPTILCVLFLTLIAIASFMVFKGDVDDKNASDSKTPTAGFTFFEVGPSTELTKKLRDDLESKLGSGSVETWSTINLEFHNPGFLEKYFPLLHDFNKRLNDALGQRVEHDTVKLTYRYIHREVTPFDYVEIMFSGHTGFPLYCKIEAKREGDDILALLRSKYGEPRKIQWGKSDEYSFFWMKSDDILVFSSTPDLLGNPAHRIVIYYTRNLEELIRREEKKKARAAEEKEDALKKAF